MSNGDYFDVDIDRLVEWAEINGLKYDMLPALDGIKITDPTAGRLIISRKAGMTLKHNDAVVDIEAVFVALIQDLVYNRAERE